MVQAPGRPIQNGGVAARNALSQGETETCRRDGLVVPDYRLPPGTLAAMRRELDADQFDPAAARDVVLEPGQISLHDVYLIHGSAPNRSARRRAGYGLRLMPATSHFDRALGAEITKRTKVVDFENRALHLLRGVDRSGLNDFSIGH